MSIPEPPPPPSPQLFFETATAFQRTAALKAAVDVGLFSALAKSSGTADEVAARAAIPLRSARILCDYLTFTRFLTKTEGRYALTPDSAMFLDEGSPAYLGGALRFLLSPMLEEAFAGLGDTVRSGNTVLEGQGSVSPEHPAWVDFARGMAPLMAVPAQLTADRLTLEPAGETRVLDLACGHGLFGIEMAKRNPEVRLTALDWAPVLEVARENAAAAGVDDRFETLAGDAFEVDFGTGYDVVLLTNFLHHFDVATCEKLLRKVAAALNPRGRAAAVEFVVGDDRISPPGSAGFPLVMLATTPHGDAYTYAEYERMFRAAGFVRSELHDLSPTMQQLVISHR